MPDILTLRKFEGLSPFEIKDELIGLGAQEAFRAGSGKTAGE